MQFVSLQLGTHRLPFGVNPVLHNVHNIEDEHYRQFKMTDEQSEHPNDAVT